MYLNINVYMNAYAFWILHLEIHGSKWFLPLLVSFYLSVCTCFSYCQCKRPVLSSTLPPTVRSTWSIISFLSLTQRQPASYTMLWTQWFKVSLFIAGLKYQLLFMPQWLLRVATWETEIRKMFKTAWAKIFVSPLYIIAGHSDTHLWFRLCGW
jgi:hypothetical protein